MNDSDNIKDDYEFTRETLRDLVEKGSDAFENMVEVARESEHPRAYEVLSGMLKNIADISEKLVDVNKKQRDLTTPKGKEAPALPNGSNVTNNVFVGSTTDLQRMLSNMDSPEEIIDLDSDKVSN